MLRSSLTCSIALLLLLEVRVFKNAQHILVLGDPAYRRKLKVSIILYSELLLNSPLYMHS